MRQVKFISLLFFVALSLLMACNDDDCIGRPIEDCACPAIYDPVCGCNDVTYGNACEAGCNGISEYTSGECN